MCSQPNGDRCCRQGVVDHLSSRPQRFDGALQIDGVPQDDGRDDQVAVRLSVTFASTLAVSGSVASGIHQEAEALVWRIGQQ